MKIKCKDDCNNKGVCNTSGKCGCNKGWFGVSCENKITCPNNCTSEKNGNCQENGTCICNPLFEGEDCSKEKPKKIKQNENEKKSAAFISLKSKETDEFLKRNFRFFEVGKRNESVNSTNDNYNSNFNATLKNENEKNQGQIKIENQKKEKNRKNEIEMRTKNTKKISEKVKDSVVINGLTYEVMELSECPNKCSLKGKCYGNVCFCKPGRTSEDCSMKVEDVKNKPYKVN